MTLQELRDWIVKQDRSDISYIMMLVRMDEEMRKASGYNSPEKIITAIKYKLENSARLLTQLEKTVPEEEFVRKT